MKKLTFVLYKFVIPIKKAKKTKFEGSVYNTKQ